MLLEVIAKNIEDIIEINKSKANRIEYCVDLNVGGLTPKIEDIKKAVLISEIPIMIMLRQHYDTFEISSSQLNNLILILKELRKIGVYGVVFGAIKNNSIDKEAIKQIKENSGNMEITFHKAFDYVKNYVDTAEYLSTLNINTILTSGGQGDPYKNKEVLKSILNSKITILVGGGVNINNIAQLKEIGIENFHIGTGARNNSSWDGKINISLINKYVEIINS